MAKGKLNRVIVPMGQFVNPNSPETNAGSVNLTLDTHPVKHAKGYGADVTEENVAGLQQSADTPEMIPYVLPTSLTDKPEDEWTKEDYKEALAAGNQSVSGNKDKLVKRWAKFKANHQSDEQ